MTKRIGMVRKRFLTRERLMLIVEYLIRPEKQRNWTASQQKRWQIFLSDYESNIDRIYYQLRYQVWKPQPFIIFDKQEGKKMRHIYESYPESLIVDSLFLDCLNYVFFEKKQIIPENCYGSIKGKGQHELRGRIIKLVRGRRDLYGYSGDTSKYYPTMDQQVLMNTLKEHIKDRWLLWLCGVCIHRIEGMQGIALGLPSSNPIGHIYHAILDWYIVLTLKVRRYFRFCDDKWAFPRDVNYLHTVAREISGHTDNDLSQNIKQSWRVFHCQEQRFECLGAVINSHGGRLKSYNRRRIERKIKRAIQKHNPLQAMQTWGGIKGGLKSLSVSNLIRYWKEVYPEFFHLIRWQKRIFAKRRKFNRRHKKLEKILTKAKDCRSIKNQKLYPYGPVNTKEKRKAA